MDSSCGHWRRNLDLAGAGGECVWPANILEPIRTALRWRSFTGVDTIGKQRSAQPVFQWTAVSGAASYWLRSRSVDSVNVIRQTALTATSYTSSTTLQAGAYRAWIRAVSTSGEVSIWSRSIEFTVVARLLSR